MVAKFEQPDLSPKLAFPVLAVGGSAGHCAEKIVVDLDHLGDGPRGYVGPLSGSGIDGDDDPLLEHEAEGGGSVSHLDVGCSGCFDLVFAWHCC